MQSILKRLFQRGQTLPNICIMGLDSAGKTTLLYKIAFSEITTIIPTIGFHIDTANIQVSNRLFTARVADAGGCAKIYPLVRLTMIEEGDVSAIIWVVDASLDKDWLDASLEELDVLLHGPSWARVKEHHLASSIPILILANKIDRLPDRKVTDEFRARFDQLLQGRPHACFGTAITEVPRSSCGLEQAFAWLEVALTASTTSSSPPSTESSATTRQKQTTTAEGMLSNMRAPAALSAKLEDWLARADKEDPVTSSEELLRRFYALDLPSWDHFIHLRLAYILLLKYGRKEGKDKIFDEFKSYIDNNGKGVHGGKSFHLTMTYFWVQMVHLGIARGSSMNMDGGSRAVARESHSLRVKTESEATVKAENDTSDFARFLMVNPYLVDGQLWADYYSKEVLMSTQAKQGLVFPDVKNLPDVL